VGRQAEHFAHSAVALAGGGNFWKDYFGGDSADVPPIVLQIARNPLTGHGRIWWRFVAKCLKCCALVWTFQPHP
jgi:hypothetical protein